MKTWNFGIIGAGSIADFHARAIDAMPNAQVVSVCDSATDRADKFAQKYNCRPCYDYNDLLTDPEVQIVAIATPSGAHAEPAIAAAKAAKHVICEKPLDITLERIDAMIDAHQHAGTYLGCIFQNRFSDAVVVIRQAIDDGRFGTITSAGAYGPWWRTPEYYKNSWHGTRDLDGGGALMNQSIHFIDMLCAFMGPVQAVQAFTANIGHPYIEVEDTAVASLRFANGALGVVYGTSSAWPGFPARVEISGTAGTVIYSDGRLIVWQFADEKTQDKKIREQFNQPQLSSGASDPNAIDFQGHQRNFTAFIKAIETNTPYCLDGPEARKSVQLILAIYQSAKEQKMIAIP